ncbi:unnamed protein product [Heligmosomoides polygyrus]|uniref:EF-hand domain-containing protein n=1 Tax=Heligmosomoides polygyrus TaxID=6339 RepID=A0A183FY48_HELPZ|nr:unnamed protein product [Heligmosomoides polygyrus]
MANEVERLFNLCDAEGKGYLTEQDLQHICPQLDQKDIEFIFAQLDTDGSGKIEKEEFCNGFKKAVLEGENRGCFSVGISSLPSRLRNLDDDLYNSESDTNMSIDFSLPCQEEVIMLYQQLQSAGVPQLLRKYERIVGSFYKEIKDQKDENQRLQHVYETEKDMYNKRMEEVEIELDQQVMMAERKAREEERQRLTKEKEEMQSRMAEEMRTMQKNIERLQKMETVLEKEGQKLSHQKELQERLKVEVCSENNELRRGLAENHLELAMIKSELAHVRADYEHKQNELIRQKEPNMYRDDIHFSSTDLSVVSQESETMHRQIQLLFEANKKLHETNESLRDALDSRASVIKQFNLVSSLISCHRSSRTRCLTSQRTPSPNPALVRNASEGMVMYQSQCEPLRLPTPATLSELPTEEDGEHIPLETAGSVLSFEICSRFGSRNVV